MLPPGDIDGSGSLLSGNSVNMQLIGDVTNGGTIAGREVVKIDAANIQNLGGRVSGGQVQLKAREDINNIGGTIDAATQLSLEAGRDVRVVTTTTQGGSTGASGVNLKTQDIDRIAGLYVTEPGGQLSVKAGQDVILQGAQVQSQGSAGIEAGRDIQLQAVNTGEQLDASWNKNNTRQSSVTQSVGTTVSAQGGDATLLAGRDLVGEAAKLSASDTLKLEAKGNVELGGVIDEQSAHTYEKRKNGLNYYSLDATSQDQSLNRTELQGANVQIKSGGDTRAPPSTRAAWSGPGQHINAQAAHDGGQRGGRGSVIAHWRDGLPWSATNPTSASKPPYPAHPSHSPPCSAWRCAYPPHAYG